MNAMVDRLKAMFAEEAARLEQVRREANLDSLTGLSNRSFFMNQLAAAQLAESLIISVGEARKILGNDANGISDNCLTKLILDLSELAIDILKHKQNTL